MSLGDVLHESERLRIRRGEGWLVIEHSPGKDGVPSQRRLPEGRGVQWLGGLVGLLGGLAFMAAHRVTRDLTPVPVRLELGPRLLTVERGSAQQRWPVASLRSFHVGQDTTTLRTVFARTAEGRAMLLEGLPPDDARAAARALGEAMSAMS